MIFRIYQIFFSFFFILSYSCGDIQRLGKLEQEIIDESTAILSVSSEGFSNSCSAVYIGRDYFITAAHCVLRSTHNNPSAFFLHSKSHFKLLLTGHSFTQTFSDIEVKSFEYLRSFNTSASGRALIERQKIIGDYIVIDYAILKVRGFEQFSRSHLIQPPKVAYEKMPSYILSKRKYKNERYNLLISYSGPENISYLLPLPIQSTSFLNGFSGAGIYSKGNELLCIHTNTYKINGSYYGNCTSISYIINHNNFLRPALRP